MQFYCPLLEVGMITEKDGASAGAVIHPCGYQILAVLSEVSLPVNGFNPEFFQFPCII